jgi:hypothetical protein
MTNPVGLKLRLEYLPPAQKLGDDIANEPTQPVMALLKGNETLTKLVPISPLTEHDKCIGCVAENDEKNNQRVNCHQLPKCDNAIYVRANPTNLLRHLMWRLENDR